MHHRRLHRAMPLPPPRTPGVAAGRLFASLPPPPSLQSRREVHVWYLCPDELNDYSQLKMYAELISPSERKNALSMNGERLQKDAMLSRALLRTTLSRYTDCKIDPRSFEFKKNKFGKPEILWRCDDSSMEWPLHFNISHTSSLIACGIAMDAPIGIDIEEKKRKTAKSILSLARRYFTPSEVDYLAKISDSEAQQKEFIKLWTLKEAYVKALGRGFSGAPFNRFSILLETTNGIQISKLMLCKLHEDKHLVLCMAELWRSIVPPLQAPKVVCKDSNSGCDCLSENWQFALAELNSSHYMAICIEDDSTSSCSENGPVPLGLKVWKTIPFVEDTLVSGTDAAKFII